MHFDDTALKAIVKAISLGYLLGLFALSLTYLGYSLIRRWIAPAKRASVIFWVFLIVFLINSLTTVGIYFSVINGAMPMTTNFFHKLMYGGWAATFALAGLMLLGISIIIGWHQWRRGLVVSGKMNTDVGEIEGLQTHLEGMKVISTDSIPALSLVGAWHPQLWINPHYWNDLSEDERRFALIHEIKHQTRRDNQRRLVLEGISFLYFILPWIRSVPDQYEQDCELAVDDYCRKQPDAGTYLGLIAKAVDLLLPRRSGPVISALSAQQLRERIQVLSSPRIEQKRITTTLLAVSAVLIGQVVSIALLAFSVSRCLITCYLGY